MASIKVPAGGSLQAALDTVQPGDTILLQAGVEYVGNFRLRDRGATEASPITITTENFNIPNGQRVKHSDDAQMARILTPGNGLPLIEADSGAGWYKFIGIRGGVKYGSDPLKQYHSSFLIVIGNGNDSNPNYGDWLAHDISFDRCHVPGKFGDSRFAFAVSGFNFKFLNGIVDEFANPPGNDSAGFWFPNAGGHVIENSLVSAGMWCIDMGGADSDSPNRGKVVSATTSQVMLSEMEGKPPAIGDLVAFYIRPEIANSNWQPNTSYPLGTLQFHHSSWTIEAQKLPLLFYTVKGGVSGTTEPDWNAFDEYHNQTKPDGSAVWRLFNGNWQVGRVTAISGNTITFAPHGPTGIFLPPVVGSIAKWNGYNPSVIVRRNHFLRPKHWANFNAPNKGMVQIKNCANSVFEGNYWEVEPGESPNSQFNLNHRPGLFALTPGNQSYSAPWSTARDIVYRYNRARNIESVFNWALTDYTKTSTPGGNILAHDNLFEDVWHGFVVQCNAGFNVAIHNNTVLNQSEQPLKLFGDRINGLVYEDNIVGWYQGAFLEFGDLFSQNVTGASSEKNNVFVDVYDRTSQNYPPTKYFPSSHVAKSWADVGVGLDGRLTANSLFKEKGTNGKDPGADIDAIEAVMAGVMSPPLPVPTPTPVPVPVPTPTPTPTPVPDPTPAPIPPPIGLLNITGYVYRGGQRAGGVLVQVKLNDTLIASTNSRDDGFFGFSGIQAGSLLVAESVTQVVMKEDTYFLNLAAGTPVPTPDPVPTPTPTPTPACSISAPASVSIQGGKTGVIAVKLDNLSGPVDVTVLGSDGQVTVTPLKWTTTGTSATKQFSVRVKRQARVITFQSSCGSVQVKVNVV